MNGFFNQFHFLRPGALLLVIPVIVIWWLAQRQADPLAGWRKQVAPELLRALVVGKGSSRRVWWFGLLLAWMIAVVLIAGPAWRLEPGPFAEDAPPLLVLLKADPSMDFPDPEPSRIDRAHLKIADLAAVRTGQPLGLVAYAGSAHLVLPPTKDTAVVVEMAAQVSAEIMPVAGDRLDLALAEAGRILDRGERGGSVLVICDGVDTDFAFLRKVSGAFGYPVQFLAIGSSEAAAPRSVTEAARVLKARVETLAADDSDVESIARRADRRSVAVERQGSERWEESGYWLLPLLGVLLLASFRRTETGEVAS